MGQLEQCVKKEFPQQLLNLNFIQQSRNYKIIPFKTSKNAQIPDLKFI